MTDGRDPTLYGTHYSCRRYYRSRHPPDYSTNQYCKYTHNNRYRNMSLFSRISIRQGSKVAFIIVLPNSHGRAVQHETCVRIEKREYGRYRTVNGLI